MTDERRSFSFYTVSELNPALKAQIDAAIREDRPIKIRAYAILPVTEKGMSYIIDSILAKYNREDMVAPVYTAAKELAINGAKANIKTILFEENKISMDDEGQYSKGMGIFREELSEDWIFSYAKKSRERDLRVDIVYDFNPHRIIVEVINNRPISEKEDKRIRSKFQKAMAYDDIAQFYMDGGDSSEGAGMGIVLITMLLRAQGIDAHLFTIRSNYRDSTIAKVEFPLSEDYQTSRDRFEARKSSEAVTS